MFAIRTWSIGAASSKISAGAPVFEADTKSTDFIYTSDKFSVWELGRAQQSANEGAARMKSGLNLMVNMTLSLSTAAWGQQVGAHEFFQQAQLKLRSMFDIAPDCAGTTLSGTLHRNVYEQVRGLGLGQVRSSQLSEADRLNGVQFRGNVQLILEAARVFRRGAWEDWKTRLDDAYGPVVILGEFREGSWSLGLRGTLNTYNRAPFKCSQMTLTALRNNVTFSSKPEGACPRDTDSLFRTYREIARSSPENHRLLAYRYEDLLQYEVGSEYSSPRADLNCKDPLWDNNTMLVRSAELGYSGLVEHLLRLDSIFRKRGLWPMNLDAKNGDGLTALEIAKRALEKASDAKVKWRYTKMIKMLEYAGGK